MMKMGPLVVLAMLLPACAAVDTTEVTEAVSMPTLSTESSTYAPGQPIVATWANLPGNAHDWIALSPQGSMTTTVLAWIYTNGQASGSTSFGGLQAAGA